MLLPAHTFTYAWSHSLMPLCMLVPLNPLSPTCTLATGHFEKNHQISKISKQKCVSEHSDQIWIFTNPVCLCHLVKLSVPNFFSTVIRLFYFVEAMSCEKSKLRRMARFVFVTDGSQLRIIWFDCYWLYISVWLHDHVKRIIVEADNLTQFSWNW